MSRKPYTRVSQDRYIEVLREVGGSAALEDIAEFVDVSLGTARRQLDGLAYQGKVRVYPGHLRTYELISAD